MDPSGAELEALADDRYLAQEYHEAADGYARAYAAYRKEGRQLDAGRAARMASWVTGNVFGEWAVRTGWLGRARTVLATAGPGGPENGWVLIIQAFQEPDAGRRESLCREAIAVGRQCGDPDVEFYAMSYLGGVYIMTGRVEEGLGLNDEVLAAVCAGELAEIATVDSILCGFFWACELVNDVRRADQWMRAAAELMRKRNVVAAFCRAHYGGILIAAGRWAEAESQLLESTAHFDHGMPERRAAAVIRLADLRLRQGRLEEAGFLLDGFDQHPDAVQTLASLRLARGETELAKDLLERRTGSQDDDVPIVGESIMLGPLLGLLVDAYLAAGQVERAARTAERLGGIAVRQHWPYLDALAALAAGRVCVAGGEGDARACLQTALEGFAEARLPMELARARLELAYALADRTPEVAIVEAKAALDGFERLPAAWHADRAAALLRSLGAPVRTGPKGVGTLTKREAEVLALLGAGLSNGEIGDRLVITRKTVEHHVSNVLSKLGLRNRAEAVAYVTRERSAAR